MNRVTDAERLPELSPDKRGNHPCGFQASGYDLSGVVVKLQQNLAFRGL